MVIDYLLLAFSSVNIGLKNFFAKKSNQHLNNLHNVYTYNFYMFLIAFVISVIIGAKELVYLNPYIIVMGLLYSVFVVGAQTFLIKATCHGGISISSLFYACAFLVPLIFTVIAYRDYPSAIQIVGVVLLLISFAITLEKTERANVKWFVFAISAMMCSGAVGIIQKLFGMSADSKHIMALMPVAFFGGAVLTFILMPKRGFTVPSKGFLLVGLGSGITLGITNTVNVYITGVLPGVIVFSCVNGGGIAASAVIAAIFAKERLSLRKTVGLIISIIAICLIAI